jgi:hypothetical protein
MLIRGRIITDGAISQETIRMDGVINLKTTKAGPLEKVGDYFLKSLQLNYNFYIKEIFHPFLSP